MSGGHQSDGPSAYDEALDALEAGATTPRKGNHNGPSMSYDGGEPSPAPETPNKAFSKSFSTRRSPENTHGSSPINVAARGPKSALKKGGGNPEAAKSFEDLVSKKGTQSPANALDGGKNVANIWKRVVGLGSGGLTRRPSGEEGDSKLADEAGGSGEAELSGSQRAVASGITRFLSKKTLSKASIKSFAVSEEGGRASPLPMVPRTKSTAQAVSYLRKARALEAKGAKALDPTQLDETSNWVKMHEFAVKNAADKQTKQGSGMSKERGVHVSAVSGKVTATERAKLRRIEQATALAGYAGKGDAGHPNASPQSIQSVDDEEELEDEEFMLNEVDQQLELDRENYTDSIVSIMRDLCKGSRFVVAELWSLPNRPQNLREQALDVDETGVPLPNWGRPGPDQGLRGDEETHERVTEDLDPGGTTPSSVSVEGHSQAGFASQPASTRHTDGGGGSRQPRRASVSNVTSPDAVVTSSRLSSTLSGGIASLTRAERPHLTPTASRPTVGGGALGDKVPLQHQNSLMGGVPRTPGVNSLLSPSSPPGKSSGFISFPGPKSETKDSRDLRRRDSQRSIQENAVSSMPASATNPKSDTWASTGDGEPRYFGEESGVDSLRTRTKQKEYQARGRSSQVLGNVMGGAVGNVMGGAVKGMKRAIKASNIVRTSERLCYTGRRYVQDRFFELPKSQQSVYHQKKIDVSEGLKNLDEKAKANQYDVGQGLPGECWLRNDLDWNLLATLRDDPERPFDAHLNAAAYLFHASIAIPIFDIVKPHSLVAVVIMYTPHEHGDSRIHEYLDPKLNPEVGIFLKQMSVTVPLALRWMQTKDQWEKEYRSFVEDPKQHARRMWRVLRIVVATGWLRICKSDKTPRNPVSRALFQINNMMLPRVQGYFKKWKGLHLPPPPRGDWSWSVQSFFGSVVGLGVLGGSHYHFNPPTAEGFPSDQGNIVLLVASFAAVICLIFAAPTSPYAQPRMVVGGHVVSVSVAIIMNYLTLPEISTDGVAAVALPTAFIPYWLSVAITPSVAIAMMTAIGVVHPPAAACCLIFITAGDQIKDLGWLYLAMPTLTGCCLLILVGLIFNNLFSNRKYPMFW